jgi:PncC family amidohydrolase
MSLTSIARRVAKLLAATDRKVVFAESCTGGLVSATLTKIPGISDHHCGGMVVYRNESKTAYLGIPRKTLEDPGPVSAEVARLMARRVLAKTPEADISLAVTGHLGPKAPADIDGLVFVGIAVRKPAAADVHELHCRRDDSRVARQRWVVERALELLADRLTHVRR